MKFRATINGLPDGPIVREWTTGDGAGRGPGDLVIGPLARAYRVRTPDWEMILDLVESEVLTGITIDLTPIDLTPEDTRWPTASCGTPAAENPAARNPGRPTS